MTKSEIKEFIREMNALGDFWEPDDVERCYGDDSLEAAIESRTAELDSYKGIFETLRNAGYDTSGINDPRIN